jgi:hypothetical protein
VLLHCSLFYLLPLLGFFFVPLVSWLCSW